MLELGNGHFLILICQNRKQHRQIVNVHISATRSSMLKIELRGVASSQKFEENRQSIKNDDV